VAGHQLSGPLELVGGLVELVLAQVHDAEVVVGGAEEEVGRERLAQELLGAFGVRVDQVRGLLREPLAAQRVARPALGGGGVGACAGARHAAASAKSPSSAALTG